MPFTFLRNSFYTENYAEQIPSYLQRGEILGASDGARIPGAARADYAAAAATVLADQDGGHHNAVYELGGPAFTMAEVAAAVSQATSTTIGYRNVTPEQLQSILVNVGQNSGHATFVAEIERGTARGDVYTDSRDLSRLIGREPTPLTGVLAAAATLRTPSRAT